MFVFTFVSFLFFLLFFFLVMMSIQVNLEASDCHVCVSANVLHDDDLLLKIPYHFILVRLDDVMRMETELDLMFYALNTSEAR